MPDPIPSFEDFKAQQSQAPMSAIPSFEDFARQRTAGAQMQANALAGVTNRMNGDPGATAVTNMSHGADPAAALARADHGVDLGAFNPGYADGAARMTRPGLNDKLGGASQIVRTAGRAVAPLALGIGGASAPAATALGMTGGAAGSAIGGGVANLMHAPEGYRDAAEDVGGIVGGGIGAKIPSAFSAITEHFPGLTTPAFARNAVEALPGGTKILKAYDTARQGPNPWEGFTAPPQPQFNKSATAAPGQWEGFKPAPKPKFLKPTVAAPGRWDDFQPAPVPLFMKAPAPQQMAPIPEVKFGNRFSQPEEPQPNQWEGFKPAPRASALKPNRFSPSIQQAAEDAKVQEEQAAAKAAIVKGKRIPAPYYPPKGGEIVPTVAIQSKPPRPFR